MSAELSSYGYIQCDVRMTPRRKDKGKRLSVLTDAEKFALYGLPDFDEGQQLEYLSLTAEELALATSRPGDLLHPADGLF